jgi:hypothetical protein
MSYLFENEGENSILSYLKREGYAYELVSGFDHNF